MKKFFKNLLKNLSLIFKRKDLTAEKSLASEMVNDFKRLLTLNGTSLEELKGNANIIATSEDDQSKALFKQGNILFKEAEEEFRKAMEIINAKRAEQIQNGKNIVTEAETLANQAILTRKAIAAMNIPQE